VRPHAPGGGQEAPDLASAGGAGDVPAITELAAELVALGVQMVPVEATSDYWRIWFGS
jgi:hypothetical protein